MHCIRLVRTTFMLPLEVCPPAFVVALIVALWHKPYVVGSYRWNHFLFYILNTRNFNLYLSCWFSRNETMVCQQVSLSPATWLSPHHSDSSYIKGFACFFYVRHSKCLCVKSLLHVLSTLLVLWASMYMGVKQVKHALLFMIDVWLLPWGKNPNVKWAW